MGTVLAAMFAIFVVGVVILAVVAGWHHLAGSATSARLRRRHFHLMSQVYRIGLSGSSWSRSGRRHLAARMSDVAERTVSTPVAAPSVALPPVTVPADPGDLVSYAPVAQRAA